jgi:heterotetrameric sarcosine oxidase gamma subunit
VPDAEMRRGGAAPVAHTPVPDDTVDLDGGVRLDDNSLAPTWRVFGDAYPGVVPGTARRVGDQLVWSVTPGEWTVVGPRPAGDTVDLTHVRAMFRLTGEGGARLLARVCALDLDDAFFPPGAGARTLVAGVATELVRDDTADGRSYLVVPSRSLADYHWRPHPTAGIPV